MKYIKPFIDQILIRYFQQYPNENSAITEGLSSLSLKVEVFLRQIEANFGCFLLIFLDLFFASNFSREISRLAIFRFSRKTINCAALIQSKDFFVT